MDKLTKTAFQTLCSENLIWIQQWPDCLEKRHIEDILIDCPKLYYDGKARIASLEAELKERNSRINDIHEAVAELIGGADDVAGYDICVGRVDYEMLVDMFPLPSPPITEKE